MANAVMNVLLDKGLDTVTPPTVTEPGSLIDCLNYEMTGVAGYRRIDGYERFDGWVNGDIADYYRVPVTIDDPGVVASLVPGASITNAVTTYTFGIVVAYSAGLLTYIPSNKDLPLIPDNTTLSIYPTSTVQMTTTDVAAKGSIMDPFNTFITNIRAYATILRNLVLTSTTPIAGLHWYRNTLLLAVDTYSMTYSADGPGSEVIGQILDYQGYRYRIVYVVTVNPEFGTKRVWLQRISTIAPQTFPSTINRLTGALEIVSNSTPTLIESGSEFATLSYANSPETAYTRGITPLHSTVWVQFINGGQISGADPVPGSIVRVRYDDTGSVGVDARIINLQLNSGAYSANTAAGWVELQLKAAGFDAYSKAYLSPSDKAYVDSTWADDVFTFTGQVRTLRLAGTIRLRQFNTRYDAATYNFYGQEATTEAYLVTGASAGAYARIAQGNVTVPPLTYSDVLLPPTGFFANYSGLINTQPSSEEVDYPKYVTIHKGIRLALGYGRGSVVLSVAGEPLNYSGTEGAIEIATGDAVTGLVEAPGDALIVFGRRAIRRITGSLSADMALETINGSSGCFDYTATLVGSDPTFVGPAGISTLEQSAAYGDFVGARLSYRISTTVLDEIVPNRSNSELGGVAMAMAVRTKNQYRVWLGTGKVICVTMTQDGPKLTYLNYGHEGDNRVPFAWTSEMADYGKEQVLVVWDTVRAERMLSVTGVPSTIPSGTTVYQLERGWGFDGEVFNHRFELGHLFTADAAMMGGIEKVRLFGKSHGLASLRVRAAGIEHDFDQTYDSAEQDISMPSGEAFFSSSMRSTTSIIDHANWGLGIKLKIEGSDNEGAATTEPSHVCQVLVLQVRSEGAKD